MSVPHKYLVLRSKRRDTVEDLSLAATTALRRRGASVGVSITQGLHGWQATLTVEGLGHGSRWPAAVRRELRNAVCGRGAATSFRDASLAERRAFQELAERHDLQLPVVRSRGKAPDSKRTSRAKAKSRSTRALVRRPNPGHPPLMDLVTRLMAIKLYSWNLHWNAAGANSYGDHLLLERIYTSIDENIDKLGERLVAYTGSVVPPAVMVPPQVPPLTKNMSHNLQHLQGLVMGAKGVSDRARLGLEAALGGVSTSGLDDYLMSLNNDLDTFTFLLDRRLA